MIPRRSLGRDPSASGRGPERSARMKAVQDRVACWPSCVSAVSVATDFAGELRCPTTAGFHETQLSRSARCRWREGLAFYAVPDQTVELMVRPCQSHQRIGVRRQLTLGVLRQCHSRREPSVPLRQAPAASPEVYQTRGNAIPARLRTSVVYRIEAHDGPSRTARHQGSCLSP